MTHTLPNPGTDAAARHLRDGIADASYIQLEAWFGGVWARVMDFSPPFEEAADPEQVQVIYVQYDRHGTTRRLRSARLNEIRRFTQTLPKDAGTVHEADRRIDFGSAILWPTPVAPDLGLFRDEFHPAYVRREWEASLETGPNRPRLGEVKSPT